MKKNKHRCRHCNHTWTPRKENPKKCPHCGRTDWRFPSESAPDFDSSNSSIFPGLAND